VTACWQQTTRIMIAGALAVIMTSTTPLPAQQKPQQARQEGALQLTLGDAIRRAFEHSHTLRELDARRAQAEANVGVARAADLPQVSAQASYTRTNHVDQFGLQTPDGVFRIVYPDIPDNYTSRLDVQWPVFDWGRSRATRESARAEARAAGRDETDGRAALRLEVVNAYWAVVTGRETVTVREGGLERLGAQLRDVKAQLDAGLVPPSDVLNVEAQESAQRAQLIDAEAQRDTGELLLRELLGLAPDVPIELVESLGLPPATEESLTDLAKTVAAGRADRQALAERVESARRRAQAADAGDRPSMALAAGVDYARPNPRIFPRNEDWNDSWDVSARVTWPLFDGGRADAETAAARAAVAAAEARLAEYDRQLRIEIGRRQLELRAARASVQAAEDGVRSATEARRVLDERFAAGVATSTDLLDAQVALLQAELTRTSALANAQLAAAALDRAVGR
jgi:outer membrane protein